MEHRHIAVWLDHEQARVFALTFDRAEGWTVRPHQHHVHRHHKAGLGDAGKRPADTDYFGDLAASIADAGEILVTGPSSAKNEFMVYLRSKQPAVERKVAAVETLDHPTDGEFIRHARKYFRSAGHLHGTVPM